MDVRALLDLLCEHHVSEWKFVLKHASSHLKILDPEHGEEELVKSMEVSRTKLLRL